MRTITALVCCCACLGVSGCASRPQTAASAPPPVRGGTALPDSAFLAILRSVPPAQRQAYVRQHPDQVSHIQQSPNSTDRVEYALLTRAK